MKYSSYIKGAVSEIKKLRSLITAALMVTLSVIISSFYIPFPFFGLGGQLRIYFSFIVHAVGGAIYGPFMGMIAGGVADLVGYALHPTGPFFPGYTLSAILGGLIYGLFLYKRRITVLRLFLCKLTVNIFVNVLIGCLWRAAMSGKGYFVFFIPSLVKNLSMLPIETLILFLVFKAILPILRRVGIIKDAESVTLY